MTDTDSSQAAYEEILAQHVRLRSLLDDIKQLLFEQSVAFSEVANRLLQLREMVVDHFQTEENSGCFGEVVNHAPHVSERVAALIGEHEDLIGELRDLEARAVDCPGVNADWEEVGARFGEFMARLMQHETLENELLQQVFTEDIGSKD